MTKVIKRDRKDSAVDLIRAIDDLNPLLAEQGEHDAVAHLQKASATLKNAALGSVDYVKAVEDVIDAFEGDLELSAYTMARKDSKEWTAAEELTVASCRVLNLAHRMKS
jgi:pantothenate synthetase